MIDPNEALLRPPPRDERDLVIAAPTAGWSRWRTSAHISAVVSDALCRIATGSGFGTRELYTDAEEALFRCSFRSSSTGSSR